MGLVDTLSLFGAAVLAIPMGLLGVEFLIRGRTVAGVGFLAVGAALLAGTYYLPGVTDEIAGAAASVVLGGAAETEAGDDTGEVDASGAPDDRRE